MVVLATCRSSRECLKVTLILSYVPLFLEELQVKELGSSFLNDRLATQLKL